VKGNPVREWGLFSLVWLLLLWPVYKLTVEPIPVQADLGAEPTTHVEPKIDFFATLRFTELPLRVTIKQFGQTVWEIDAPREYALQQPLVLTLDDRYVELSVIAEWSGEGPRVLELVLEPEAAESLTRHAWTEKSLDELFIYHWEEGIAHD